MVLSVTKLAIGNQSPLTILFGAALVIALLIALFFPWLNWFYHELKYIKEEMKRNVGREKQRWIRRKRRLWLSILPFVKYK